MKIRVSSIFLIFINSILSVGAQVSVDLPVNNSVFQRNSSNLATIYIGGAYQSSIVTSIQSRLVTPGTSSPVSGFDWTIIEANPTKGKYFGQLNSVPAGWYILEIRSVNTGSVLSSTSISRIGVGDVYLISGQSNAAGWAGVPVPNDFTEKNITQNAYQGCGATIPSFPSLSAITNTHKLSVTGESSWTYGKLGKLLSDNLNIPVAFFNGATSGASIENWLSSSNGSPTVHSFTGQQFCIGNANAIGSPYNIFNKVLNYYPSLFGVRALIWQQGESDTHLNTSSANYQSRLTSFISKTRTDFGATIPWMVARSSYYNHKTSANVIIGQNNVIGSVSQVFPGPVTDEDTLSGDRYDEVHFGTSGLIKFANKLYNAITAGSFLSSSTPISSKVVPQTNLNITNGVITLSVPSGYSSYKWVSGNNFTSPSLGTTNTFVTSSGTYRCYMTDGNGNITISQSINADNILAQQTISTTFVDSLYLSIYTPYSMVNGLGPVSFNQSVGSSGDGDGSLMEINGISYTKGIGTHSGSETVYKMPTGFSSRFKASIGIDDDSFSGASVKFKVYGENTLLYTSAILTHVSNAVNIDINIAGYSSIKLVVENSGGTAAANQANWANARIIYDKPKDLTLSLLSTKCLELSWTAANDLNGIVSYKLYKNDTLQATIPTGILTYKFDSLSRNISYTLSVKAVDANGFETTKIDTTVSTLTPSITYNANNQICIGDNVTPALAPSGGVFRIVNKPDSVAMTLNQTTGELNLSTDGFVLLRYVWEDGSACKDSASFYVGAIEKPSPPNISTSTNILINKGQSISFSSTACVSPYVLEWQNASTASTLMASPTDTSSYFAFCKNSNCYSGTSNTIKVNVIPDCPNSFTLVSSLDDINYGSSSFNFFASTSIKASHKIFNPSGAIFKAGQKITLNPGFEIKAGSVFSATIGGCP
ncbi:MAG: hypothetical protein ACI9IP_003060 [Arcticibacterium sp.]